MKNNSLLETLQTPGRACIHPWFYLWINAAGDATICPQNRTRLGSLDSYSLEDIWKSQKVQEIREFFLKGEYEKAGCERECPYLRGEYKHASEPIPKEELVFPDVKLTELEPSSASYTNIMQGVDAYETKLTDIENKPVVLDAQNILTCNADCIMCGQPHTSKLKHSHTIHTQIIEASKYLCALRWQGGEVFLDSDFIPYISKIAQEGSDDLVQIIITNATLLDEEKIDTILDQEGRFKFIVSMDGLSKEVVSSIRRKLKYEKIFNTLTLLSRKQKERKVSDLVMWNYTLMYSNIDEVADAIIAADEMEVHINLAAIQGAFEKENLFEFDLVNREKWLSYLHKWEDVIQKVKVKVSGLEGLKSRYEKGREKR